MFDDVLPADSETGLVDHRCLYVFNDGEDPVYSCGIWMDSEVEGGSNIDLGVAYQNEVQRIVIRGGVTSGTLTLAYKGNNFTSAFDSNINQWASNIQSLMNGLVDENDVNLLQNVTVSGQISGNNRYLDVTYGGVDGGRDHNLLTVVSNTLSPTPTIDVQLLIQGSPVNTVAPLLDVDTTPPGGVTFYTPTEDIPIRIWKLNSGEGFPLWARRTTTSGSTSLEQDGFKMKIRFESLPPLST
jgi:hypothetical protein